MTVADHTVVGEVGFAAWKSSDALGEEKPAAETLDKVRQAYAQFPSKAEGKIYVAELDGRIVGWAARETDPNYISDAWVDPGHQGKGVGRALVLFLCNLIRSEGHPIATIHAHAKNDGAIRLYERCGFVVVWRGPEYSTSLARDVEKVHLEKSLG